MLYLDTRHVDAIGTDWKALGATIDDAVRLIASKDYVQPIKPYLRYSNPGNRIIAMPAYAGGQIALAGIKWIASFPDNLQRGLPRAHSVTILNAPDSGKPLAIVNTASVSAIRTAAVSGAVIRRYLAARPDLGGRLAIGIVGFGPIGQTHLRMMLGLIPEQVGRVLIHDSAPSPPPLPADLRSRVEVCADWQSVFSASDIFVTATTATRRYIDRPARAGTLHLNVSLRDYQPGAARTFQRILVDDWAEVCRENTDIELMHREYGLQEADTITLAEAVAGDRLADLRPRESVLFNPMGMAVFDIAVAGFYYRRAQECGGGISLPD